MIPVLFLSHPQQECGVHQFGKQIFRALELSKRYRFIYREVSSSDDLRRAATESAAHAVIVNWHFSTMPWAQEPDFWALGVPVIGLIHETTEAIGNCTDNIQFDYYITHDPSATFTNPIFFASARPILPFEPRCEPPRRPTIGSFGFATRGKGFEALVARAHAEFDDCLIRLNIPYSFFCDADGSEARATAERCREIITKPGVQLEVSHDFLALDDTLEFLSRNSLNAFLYEPQDGRGISSAVDLAISAGRPIALRRSPMFRHLFGTPSLFVEQRSIKEILSDGSAMVVEYRKRWSLDRICRDYEVMLDSVLADQHRFDTHDIRQQWKGRIERLREANLRTAADIETRVGSATALAQTSEARAQAAEACARAADERAEEAEARADAADERAEKAEVCAGAADERAEKAEACAGAAEARALSAELRAKQAITRAQNAKAQALKSKARLRQLKSSFSWRSTKPIRVLAKFVSRRLGRLADRWVRPRLLRLQVCVLYQKAILYRHPWRFPIDSAWRNFTPWELVARFLVVRLSERGRASQRKIDAPMHGNAELVKLATHLGGPGSFPTPERLAFVSSALRAIDRQSDQCLVSRRFSPEERQAILELEFALYIATAHRSHSRQPSATLDSPKADDPIYVLDARCLQDADFRRRGVGLHALQVLTALNRVARPAGKVVLLLDPTMDPVDPEVAMLCDQQVFSCSHIELSRVALFVNASPMTASVGPIAPLLLAPHVRRVAVIYDFIPAEFPSRYLRLAVHRLRYQARYMALGNYDAFLPISEATAARLRARLTDARTTVIGSSGVADPLFAVSGTKPRMADALPERYIIAPTGGDSRKNLPIVIAAEALNRLRGKKRNHITVIGHLTQDQQEVVLKLGRRSGLSDTDITFLSNVSSSDLKTIYRRALICVVPSFAEGFSIPVTEAVHSRVAVVASDIPSHRELLGDGPWLASPSSVADVARAMRTTIRARHTIARMQKKNLGDSATPEAVHDRIAGLLKELLALPLPRELESDGGHMPEGRRPRIAVATPWPPQMSGIADYSRHTIMRLSDLADVTILTNVRSNDGESLGDRKLAFREIDASAYLDSQYDCVLTVLGNSHFHLPGFEYLLNVGGAVLAHDNRMVEFYSYLLGPERTAHLLSAPERVVQPSKLQDLLLDLDQLPSLGYAEIGRVAKPLLVHSKSLRDRLSVETDACVAGLPFVPYRHPGVDGIGPDLRQAARRRRGINGHVLHIATFGGVDRRTKGSDLLTEALAWINLWKIPARLHFVGMAVPPERRFLDDLAAQTGIQDLLVFHDHMDQNEYSDMLLAVDVAVQLRTSTLLTLSGALMDCIAFGVPTIVTQTMAAEVDAPPFVTATPDQVSPLLVAEAIVANATRRDAAAGEIENQRLAYLVSHSAEQYAVALLESLQRGGRAAQ